MADSGPYSDGSMPAPNHPFPSGIASHGVVKPPNVQGPAGSKVNNSFMPLTHGASTVHPANQAHVHGDRREGTMPLTGHSSPVHPSNREFDLGMSHGHEPTPVASPGHGSVPVNPFMQSGVPAKAMPISEMARSRSK